jgi:hypothetical protein
MKGRADLGIVTILRFFHFVVIFDRLLDWL